MNPSILHLHHVTATVSEAQPDLDFYTGLLGMRLVKKTVNFDNHGVYHFYYGNETGTPGSLMTTFPYSGMGVPVGRKGAGQITGTAFSVPAGTLEEWKRRIERHGLSPAAEGERFGERYVALADPSGLLIELVATGRDPREPWPGGGVDRAMAIRGIHSLSLTVRQADASSGFLRDLLGFRAEGTEKHRTRMAVQGGGPGHTLDLVAAPDAEAAQNGLGTVHHLALAVATPEAQLAFRERIAELGVPVTRVLDRQYFQSIYFREPGGILYEIATVPPGFLVDEEREALGQALKLPPWEEANRPAIEAALPPVSVSRTSR